MFRKSGREIRDGFPIDTYSLLTGRRQGAALVQFLPDARLHCLIPGIKEGWQQAERKKDRGQRDESDLNARERRCTLPRVRNVAVSRHGPCRQRTADAAARLEAERGADCGQQACRANPGLPLAVVDAVGEDRERQRHGDSAGNRGKNPARQHRRHRRLREIHQQLTGDRPSQSQRPQIPLRGVATEPGQEDNGAERDDIQAVDQRNQVLAPELVSEVVDYRRYSGDVSDPEEKRARGYDDPWPVARNRAKRTPCAPRILRCLDDLLKVAKRQQEHYYSPRSEDRDRKSTRLNSSHLGISY